MRKCVRATFLTVRDALRELEQDNTESQATDGTITKAFTVADKTFEPQTFVFRCLDRNLDGIYVPVQEGRVGQLHTCMACLLVEEPVTLSFIAVPRGFVYSIRSAIGTQYARR